MLPGFNHPVIRGFYANSFIKAFVLNAIAVAMVAASSVELRQLLNEEKSGAYLFFNNFLNGGKLSEVQKAVIVFVGSFVFAMFTYLFLFFFTCGRPRLKHFLYRLYRCTTSLTEPAPFGQLQLPHRRPALLPLPAPFVRLHWPRSRRKVCLLSISFVTHYK